MPVSFSEEQLKAIETRNKSLVLSASAGSGKTTVLVERIIRMVCDEKIDLERLVVVTFTNAAAAGMKDKLRAALKKRLEENPSDEHIRRQLLTINSANISTVHSFCGKLIKKYNYILKENIPVNYKLMGETDSDILLKDCFDEVLGDYYESDNPDFEEFIESYSPGRSDDELIKLLNKIYKDICCIPFYRERISDMEKSLCEGNDFFETPFADYLFEYIEKIINGILSKYKLAVEYVSSEEGLEKQIDTYIGEMEYFKRIQNEKNLEKRLELFHNIIFESLPPAKKGTDTSVSAGIRNKVKKLVEKVNKDFCDYKTPSENDILKLKVFFEIIKKVDELYNERKYESGYISFSDQEHLTLEILSNDDIAEEMRNYYYEIMVDEFQDTNDIQDYIFKRISREDNLFVVGDVKQCIYQFRHANPSIFTGKIKNAGKNGNSEVIYLNRNFRSTDNVAQTVNLVMSYIMNSDIGDIDYFKNDMLIPGKGISSPKYNTEVILCNAKSEDDELNVCEATAIAKKIESLISDGEFFGSGSERVLGYSDIVILVRSFNEKTLELLDALTGLGIPCRYDDKTNIFDTPELKLVIAFLKVIDNPIDDISLIAVMRNIFGVSDEELFEMRNKNKNSGFYEIVSSQRPDIIEKIKEFSLFCAKYGINNLIKKIYEEYFIPEKWAAIGGMRRYDNLNTLLMLSYDFELDGFKGISAFINHLDKIISSATKMMIPDSGNGKEEFVRVMTIHKSKGLEFPVVIMAGCGKNYNKTDLADNIIIDTKLGLGYNFVDVANRLKYPSIFKKVISARKLHEMLCEEARILYVALTRAEYKIIITASKNNCEKALQDFSASTYNGKFAMSYVDFITASGVSSLLVPPLLFSPSIACDGVNIPTELAPSVKEIAISLVTSYSEAKTKEEELKDSDRIKGLIYNNKPCREYNIFEYDYQISDIPGKISVTALNSIKENDTAITGPSSTFELYKPDFSKDNKVSAAQRGTMLHLVLEKIDIEEINKSKEILPAILKIMKSNKVLESNLTLDDAKKMEGFLKSPLGIKLRKSGRIYREKEFFMFMDSAEIFDTDEHRKIMVQGVIDCCFEDNGDIIIVDYKLTNMSGEDIKETYKYQIELYKLAVSRLLNVDFSRIKAYLWDINRCISYKI